MLTYDEPCGEVLRHAGVGRVQAEAGSWRRWGSGVGGDFLEQFFGCGRPCDHAATISSSFLT